MESCIKAGTKAVMNNPDGIVPLANTYYALGLVRNTAGAFETCCKNSGVTYNGGLAYGNPNECYRVCNVTTPGLRPDDVRVCIKKILDEMGISNYSTVSAGLGAPSETTTSASTTAPPTGAPSPSPTIKDGGAARMGGAMGYLFLGITFAGIVAGL